MADTELISSPKKGIAVLAIIFMIISLIADVIYLSQPYWPTPISVHPFILLLPVLIFLVASMLLVDYGKRKKLAPKKLLRIADTLSWGILVLMFLSAVLRGFLY